MDRYQRPLREGGGPAISNSHDNFAEAGGAADSYRWTTVVERMQAAGIDWRLYQDMADNFTDNPWSVSPPFATPITERATRR